jgi:hypothetical protein
MYFWFWLVQESCAVTTVTGVGQTERTRGVKVGHHHLTWIVPELPNASTDGER